MTSAYFVKRGDGKQYMGTNNLKDSNGKDAEQCVHYDRDMMICLAGFGDCGTKGKYSYRSKCGTVMYLSNKKQ